MEGMARHEVSPTFTVDETHNLSTSTTKSQSEPQWCEDKKNMRLFSHLEHSMLGETTFNPPQLLVLDKQLQRSVVAHGILGPMVPHQKTGPQCFTKIAQGWSMNLIKGARVSMSSLIYDQTPLIKGKAIQFYHLGVSLNGGTPETPQNDHF